jgi:hypothetical protein
VIVRDQLHYRRAHLVATPPGVTDL